MEFLVEELRSIDYVLAVAIEVDLGATRIYQLDQESINFFIDI